VDRSEKYCFVEVHVRVTGIMLLLLGCENVDETSTASSALFSIRGSTISATGLSMMLSVIVVTSTEVGGHWLSPPAQPGKVE